MKRIAHFAYKKSRLIIILVVIVNITALASFFRFELDTDFLNFFTEGNPAAEEYDRLNEKYGIGDSISVLIEQGGSLLDEESLTKVFGLQEEIEKIDGVFRVQNFVPSEVYIADSVFQVDEEFIDRHIDLLQDFIREDYYLAEQVLSSDSSKGVLIISLKWDADIEHVVQALREVIRNEDGLILSMAGNEIIKDTVWDYLIRVLVFLPPCAIILVLLVFYKVIRNMKFTIMAILPAGLATLWTAGTIFWSGQELNLVTALSPIFVLVVGAADGLHYMTHYIDNMNRYSDRRRLVIETLSMVGVPIFLTTITTMAGFAALTWTEVAPMRQMGIFVSLGIGYAGLLSLFFLPALVTKIELPSIQIREHHLPGIVQVVTKRRLLIMGVFLIIVIISATNIPKLEVVSNQLMFFREDSDVRKTFEKVEDYFGGALPIIAEIASNTGVNTLRDYNYAEDILDMERELERLPGINSARSIFDLVASISEMITGQHNYPESPQLVQRILLQMDDKDLGTWVSDDGFRLMITTEDLESVDMERLDDFIAEYPDIRLVTGMPVLFEEMNRLVAQSQSQSLGLALCLIFIMILVTIRRLRAALVALIPLVITIITILGMLVISNFHLNMVTANISAISIGVGVDYSIHLISAIYYFRKRGLSQVDSVDAALSVVSRPILANAFGLAIGLSVLFFSPLMIHMQVASVMWVAMVVSSMATLMLVPMFYLQACSKEQKI